MLKSSNTKRQGIKLNADKKKTNVLKTWRWSYQIEIEKIVAKPSLGNIKTTGRFRKSTSWTR
ncbi:hypothetical protein HYD78_03915 [Mycoplasmopsis bovis]|nr:hypothetical protein [Mycoplasmopsis bovis]QQH43432.1 hypothetical protein HYD78_03915 [Mycoplasmopsis bovis]